MKSLKIFVHLKKKKQKKKNWKISRLDWFLINYIIKSVLKKATKTKIVLFPYKH